MNRSTTADVELQNALHNFMAGANTGNLSQTRKIRVQTVNQATGQPMTIEMEQSPVMVASMPMGVPQNQTSVGVVTQTAPVLAQALPGGALLQKILEGHISYLIIPACGLIIAWAFSGTGSVTLVLVKVLFLVSILFELAAKALSFPNTQKRVDHYLSDARVRLASDSTMGELWRDIINSVRSEHLKKMLQWAGIGLTFLGLFAMLGFFLGATGGTVISSGGQVTASYAINSSGGAFQVR